MPFRYLKERKPRERRFLQLQERFVKLGMYVNTFPF